MPLTQPGPEGQPAFDAGERERVSGEDGAAQVRAEPLGDRAHDRPPAARARRRVVRHAGDRAEVVVLDHEHVREQRAQRRGAVGVQRRAERVVPARRDDRPARAGVQRRGQRLGPHPVVVDRDRRESQPERPRQVEHARPARVLDGQQVAGGELRREHALDPVERPVDHHDPLRRHAVGDERAARECRELGVDRRLPIQPLHRGQRGPLGKEGRVGVAQREVARARGRRRGRSRGAEGWAVGHAGARAGAGDDDAAAAQLRQGGRDRRRRHVQIGREGAHGREPRPGRQPARGDRALDRRGNRFR